MSRKKRILQALGLEDEYNELFGVRPRAATPRAPTPRTIPPQNPPAATELAEATSSRAPRRRQKPVVRTDNPGGQWLEVQRRRAQENLDEGSTRVSGSVTGSLKKPIEIDPKKLEVIPGAMGERRVPGEAQYDRLRPMIEAEGFRQDSPILVGVNHLGEPYIIEGNTRAAVARDLGIDRIPAEVRYFAGGEQVEGPMMPDLLQKYMPPSELSLDPNFRRWFEGSKVADEYGEPLSVYHGTADTFDAFSDAKIGKGDPGFLGRGFYFADNPRVAEIYSMMRSGPQQRVIEAYLALRNPFNWGPKGRNVRDLVLDGTRLPESIHDEIAKMTGVTGRVPYEDVPYAERDVALAVRDLLEGRGHDGVIATDDFSDKPIEFVAFEPTQIKSATGNRGTYDPNDPDIRKARGGLAVKRKKK